MFYISRFLILWDTFQYIYIREREGGYLFAFFRSLVYEVMFYTLYDLLGSIISVAFDGQSHH